MDEQIREALFDTVPLWPTAGQAVGYGREATYAAAQRGDFPGAFRIGKHWRVKTAPFRRFLELDQVASVSSGSSHIRERAA